MVDRAIQTDSTNIEKGLRLCRKRCSESSQDERQKNPKVAPRSDPLISRELHSFLINAR